LRGLFLVRGDGDDISSKKTLLAICVALGL
jgi:hypothetical protein